MRVSFAAYLLALAAIPCAAQDEKPMIPEPESVTLKTKDFVQLQCTFYPGGFKQSGEEVEQLDGKTVAPVVLLHGWEEKRQDLSLLARELQKMGLAVIVPDLRGHGRSTKRIDLTGREFDLDLKNFRKQDISAMVEDAVACKRYLLDLNNAGKLNIEMLTVVASDVSAMTALNWIAYDWSRPQLPTVKQGQDVKAFVLLSPVTTFKGLTAQIALRHPVFREVDGLVMVGERDAKNAAEAKRLFQQLSKGREEPPTDLYLLEPNTSLSGTKLISASGLNVGVTILRFIDARIVRKQADFPWRDRGSVLD